eukprot:759496-Hanusia_phi.AAC.2
MPQLEALSEAQRKDKAHLLATTERFLLQASSNWSLEFTTLRYEQERETAALSHEEAQHWAHALELACGPCCIPI